MWGGAATGRGALRSLLPAMQFSEVKGVRGLFSTGATLEDGASRAPGTAQGPPHGCPL